jgi:hypothetical protein
LKTLHHKRQVRDTIKLSAFQWTRSFLLFTVVILAAFGIGSLLRIIANPERAGLYGFYALAMFVDAAALLFCAWQLNRKTKFAFYLTVLVLAFNILVTIFDQIGWIDLFFVLLNLAILVMLILARKEFLRT